MGAVVELVTTAALVVMLGPGALAPADAGVLEGVADLRLRYGFGLSEAAHPSALLLAVEDCRLLGWHGAAQIEHSKPRAVYVVDCQQQTHKPLSELGIVADMNDKSLAHRAAQVWLWP